MNTIRIVPTTTFLEISQLFLDLALACSVLFQYAPLCLLALFNGLLVVSLARHSRDMKRFGGAENGNNRQMPTFGSIFKQDTGDSNIVSYPDQNVSKYTNRRSTRKLEESTSDKQQKAVTRTVMIYSFLFILLALPHTFYPLVRRFVPGLEVFQRGHYLVMALGSVFALLDTISSAMNFFIYLTTGSTFRTCVLKLFKFRQGTKTAANYSQSSVTFT